MNDRIKELAEQATKRYPATESSGEFSTFDKEKFAKLMVKDFMTMCSELQAQYLTSRKSTMDFDEKNIYAEGEAACDILRHKVKKKFGVEE